VPVIDGKAVLTNVTIPAGAHLVAAQYEGNADFSGTNTQITLTGATPGGSPGTPGTKPGGTITPGTGGGGGATAGNGSTSNGQTNVVVLNGRNAPRKHPHPVIHSQAHPKHKKP